MAIKSNGRNPIGVFQIKNIFNNKIFISKNNNLNNAWDEIRSVLKAGNHENKELQKDWKEIGETKFVFEVLGEIDQAGKEKLDYNDGLAILESYFLENLNPYGENGYNERKFIKLNLNELNPSSQ